MYALVHSPRGSQAPAVVRGPSVAGALTYVTRVVLAAAGEPMWEIASLLKMIL